MNISDFTIANADIEMKPRTKLQKTVAGLAEKLPPLSAYQERQAVREVSPHMAKHNSKKEYVCLDCGHKWKGERSTTVICPHCGNELTVDTSRKWNCDIKDYFAVVTRCGGFQVVRMFLMATHLKRGEPARYWIREAFQRWITPSGENVIISRCRHFLARYLDSFDYTSDLSLKMENAGHTVAPHKIVGQVRVIPELARNGFRGDFHDVNPYRLFNALLSNNRVETLWKVGQYELARHFINASFYRISDCWPSIKIALRHHYQVNDASMWVDYIGYLSAMGKDIRNPRLVLPENLQQAHDEWRGRLEARRAREARIREEQRRITTEQQYFQSKEYPKDARRYERLKSRFFGLTFVDGEITVTPLASIQEFADEARLMGHCVFSNKYFNKEDSLILHAIVDGTSVATIEFNLQTLEIIQCRGHHNSRPELYDRITSLIKGHINEIIASNKTQNIKNHDERDTDCA